MNRRIFNFLVFCSTILTVNLITTAITDYLMKYKNHTDVLKFTAIGMVVTVVVFYPFFEYINRITEKATSSFLKKGKNFFGKILGIYIAFLVYAGILYCLYAYIWFGANVLKILTLRILG